MLSIRRLPRLSSVLGSVSASGGLRIPDIQGEVRMNDQIKPGMFASGVVAGWVEGSPSLKKEYGKRLDIFQICDGEKEKAAAAVLAGDLAVAGKRVPCVAVLQHGAVDSFIDYLQFRASEAQSVAMRYAKEVVSDHGLILNVHHDKEPQLDKDERIIADIEKIKFTFLRPKSSDFVEQVPTGPDMQGLFDGFINFPNFHLWEVDPSPTDGRSMWVVKGEEDQVVAGISRIAKHGNDVVFSSPFLTEAATDFPATARAVEALVSHVLNFENAKSGYLVFDAKDPFKTFATSFLKSKVEATDMKIGAIPAGLARDVELALVQAPFQLAPEMLDWNIFNRL